MSFREFITTATFALGACEAGGTPLQQPPATERISPPATAARDTLDFASEQISASRRTAITEAVNRVSPAVVTVQTEKVERAPVDMFEQFFGGRSGQQTQSGIGSGFIMRQDGVIVTNEHVVNGATRISVMLRDGTTYPARLIGADDANDLAVIKVEATGLPVASLGNSEDLVIGEWAIAIGNPFGFVLGNSEPSVTAGVISATGRNLLGRSGSAGAFVGMIQTDASINPGNSGGPLVNGNGDVIGVNSSIYSPSGGSIGLGFAIPINRARRIAMDLLEHGKVRRPWIGETIESPSTGNPRDLITAGVVVRSVVPGSPAAKAGLQPGDRILRVRSKVMRNVFDWEAERLDMQVGATLPITVQRSGRELSLNVTIADLPEVSAPRITVLREIDLVTLTPAIRADRSIRSPAGALVVKSSDRIRDEIGLQEGDLIIRINRTNITNAQDVTRAFDTYAGSGMRVVWERNGYYFQQDIVVSR